MCRPADDDVCVCHRESPTATPADTSSTPCPASPLVLSEVADPGLPRRWRRALVGWLDAVGAGPELVERAMLAVSEAVTNSVEHGYRDRDPGPVTLHARLDGGTEADTTGSGGVTVEVVDRGRWRAPPTVRGHRGRGMDTIRAMADLTTVSGTGTGTTVTMSWRRPPQT